MTKRSRANHVVLLALLAGAVLGACSEEGGSFGDVDLAEILVTPREVSFSQVQQGDSDSARVTVENLGGGELIIAEWSWTSGNASDFSVDGLTDLTVPAGGTRNFTITYAPTDEVADDAVMTIRSNGGTVSVTVTTLGQAAALRTDPAEVELVAEEIGAPIAQDVRIYNTGNQAFTISGLSLITASPDFRMALRDFTVPVEVGVGGDVFVQIIYTPSGRGTDEANLLIEHDAANAVNGNTTVPINGTIRTPQIQVEPTFVEFDAVPLEGTAIENATITNLGQSNLEIRDLYMDVSSSDDFTIVALAGQPYAEGAFETVIVGPEETVELELAYTPTGGTDASATAVIFSNDPDVPLFELPMGGRVAAPILSVTPTSLGFGSVASGFERPLGLLIRNAGTEPLELEPAELDSPDGSFTLLNLADMPDTLEEGEFFELTVVFSPTVTGAVAASTVTITAPNDPLRSPVVVPLTGTGAGEPYCQIAVAPATINFGLVPRGTSATGRAAVRNTGPGPCRVNSVRLSPPPFGGIGPFGDLFSDAFGLVSAGIAPGTVLGPGESFIVEASYSPIAFTAFSESLGDTGSVDMNIVDPADGSAVECGTAALFSFSGFSRVCGINLQARSGVADIAAIPNEVDFGLVTRGCNSQNITVNLYNVGSAPVTVNRIALESCTSEYRIAGVPPEVSAGGLTLAPGAAPVPIQVRYSPASLTRSSCDLVIESGGETSRLVVPLSGEGTDRVEQTDNFEQVSGRKVDLLFVVDNSGSMSEEQSNLGRNFGELIDVARTWGTDFQIGVITTEPDEERGGRAPGQLLGTPRIITPSTPSLATAFANNANVGDAGTGSREAGLEAAYLALSDPHITETGPCDASCAEPYACVPNAAGTASACGGYNRSFVREDASLEIVFVSDEEDQSRATVAFYIDFLRSIKGERNRALFHASAIVGPRGGCTSGAGDAEAGDRYIDVAAATGGVVGSICDSEFSTSLANIGNRAFGLRVQFFLSRIAEPGSVTVTDAGGRAIPGWEFDEASNAVVFTEDSAPRPGTEFDVSYRARCF